MLNELRSLAGSEGMVLYPNKLRKFYLGGYGFQPDVVFDVGVDHGTPWLYKTFANSHFVLIDPQPHCAEAVRSKGILKDFDFFPTALGSKAGHATLNIPSTEKGTGTAMSSLLERTDKLAESFVGVTTAEVPVCTLDEISQNYTGRFGLKIDTEGFEAQVLRGASETLKHCDFVILELSVSDRFASVAPPSEIIAMLADAGLELRDVLAMAHGQGKRMKPRHMDVLFSRWAA